VKLDPTGVAFNYATIIGGDGSTTFLAGYRQQRQRLLAGVTQGTTFPTTPGALRRAPRVATAGRQAQRLRTTLIYSTLLVAAALTSRTRSPWIPRNAHVVGYTSSRLPTKLIFQGASALPP